MQESNLNAFPSEVIYQLKTYVYRLLDPRTGETFYVGKGKGNRVFAHARAEIDGDELSDKLRRIREIRLAGLEVGHVIHRHGLDDKTAFELEAALIDAYPGLSNEAGGQDSGDRGAMHAVEILRKYCAEEAVFAHKAILVNVNREASERSVYEAVRYAWKISVRKAVQADIILANRKGLIIGAFIAHRWLPANAENFPGRWAEGDGSDGRYGFVGEPAPMEIQQCYVGKRVPDEFRKRGAAYPIKYTYTKQGRKLMPRAPVWTEEEFLVVLRNPSAAPEELAEQLPGRTVGAIESVRQGLHEFHNKGESSLISQAVIRSLAAHPGWTCSVCQQQQS